MLLKRTDIVDVLSLHLQYIQIHTILIYDRRDSEGAVQKRVQA
jgi:hypothetical protein